MPGFEYKIENLTGKRKMRGDGEIQEEVEQESKVEVEDTVEYIQGEKSSKETGIIRKGGMNRKGNTIRNIETERGEGKAKKTSGDIQGNKSNKR